MHSFHPSRGRILFEVLCALTISASCAGAWIQTGASALLGAAGAAALYGLVRLFDMRRGKPAETVEPQRIDFEPGAAGIVAPVVTADEQLTVDSAAEEAGAVSRVRSERRSGGSRKGSGRRGKTQKEPKVAEIAPAEEADVPWPLAEQPEPAELSPPAKEVFASIREGEAAHPHIEPLFEPDPFVRMPRRAFGRKAS